MAFDGAEAVRLGDGADRRNDIAWALDAANAALAADVVGAMQAALDATVAYTRMRVQFGQPLAANQVIRHRLVEMAVKLEEARSLALAANIRVGDAGEAGVRGRAVSAGKVKVSSAARFVCEQAVQLHGAMGVTDELEVGSYLKRAIAADVLFGTPAEHLRRYQSSARAAA
jgi:alkylation response protein AidB-like acyl-CoA dehydrogenase